MTTPYHAAFYQLYTHAANHVAVADAIAQHITRIIATTAEDRTRESAKAAHAEVYRVANMHHDEALSAITKIERIIRAEHGPDWAPRGKQS